MSRCVTYTLAKFLVSNIVFIFLLAFYAYKCQSYASEEIVWLH